MSLYRRLSAGVVAGSLAAVGLVATSSGARASNPYTESGNRTTACDVDWYAQSELSHGLSQDYDESGTIENDEVYSNQGYRYEVSSQATEYPELIGPGDFLLHHFTINDSAVGFRLPIATDHTMQDVTVRIASTTEELELGDTASADGTAQDPESAYFIEATLQGSYLEGGGCEITAPPLLEMPVAGDCEQALAGRTIMSREIADITVRDT